MECYATHYGGKLFFLQYFIAPALDLMACLPSWHGITACLHSRGTRDCKQGSNFKEGGNKSIKSKERAIKLWLSFDKRAKLDFRSTIWIIILHLHPSTYSNKKPLPLSDIVIA